MAEGKCPNYEINVQMCTCGNGECGNRGTCCLCMEAHRSGDSLTMCLRGPRSEETLSLHGAAESCPRREINLEMCTCTAEACGNHGVCCECLRNHWNVEGTGLPVCFR